MSNEPTAEDYRLLMEREWADLHHSRVQEWTALGVVTGTHVGLLQLVDLIREANLAISFSIAAIIGSLLGALFAVLGALMTCRHRHLMKMKLGWVYEAEERLGLVKSSENPKGVVPKNAEMKVAVEWKGLAFPRPLSTSWLILCFYILFLAIDGFALVAFGLIGGT